MMADAPPLQRTKTVGSETATVKIHALLVGQELDRRQSWCQRGKLIRSYQINPISSSLKNKIYRRPITHLFLSLCLPSLSSSWRLLAATYLDGEILPGVAHPGSSKDTSNNFIFEISTERLKMREQWLDRRFPHQPDYWRKWDRDVLENDCCPWGFHQLIVFTVQGRQDGEG